MKEHFRFFDNHSP